MLSLGKDGQCFLSLSDAEGRVRALLGLQSDGAASLRVLDEEQQVVLKQP